MVRRRIEPNKSGLHAEALRFDDEIPINIYGRPLPTKVANEVIDEVLALIKRGHEDDNAVRALSRHVANYSWVLQLGDMHSYLDWLVRKRHDGVIRRLINDPQR